MPTYRVTDPQTGRTVRLTGDSPPTDQELEDIFANLPPPKTEAAPAKGKGASGSWGPSLPEALFPRASKAQGAGKTALGGLGDISSAILRVPAAAGRTLDTKMGWSGDKPMSFVEALSQINKGQNPKGKPSTITGMVNDPAMAPSMLVGGPLAKAVGKGATLAAKAGKAALVGAGEGVTSAGFHAADDVSQGREASGGRAALEVGVNAALPGLGTAAGATLKAGGKKLVNSVIKPLEEASKQGYNVDNIFKYNLAGSLPSMLKKTDALRGTAASQVGNAVKQKGAARLNPWDMLGEVEADMMSQAQKGRYKPEAVKKAVEEYQGLINQLADPETGTVSVEQLHNLKKMLQDDAKKLYNSANIGGNLNATEGEQVARTLGSKFRAKVEELIPEVAEPNKVLSETKGIDTALKRAERRLDKNNPLSLSDLILATGGIGTGVGSNDNDLLGGFGGGLTGLLLSKGMRNPSWSPLLYKAGQSLEDPGTRAQALRALLYRPGMTGAFSGGQEKK